MKIVLEVEPRGASVEVVALLDGEVVGHGFGDPVGAAQRAVSDCLELSKLRPPSARRGPDVVVLYDPEGGWPLSNLHRDGCKHTILADQEEAVRRGESLRCAKCEALLVPVVRWEPEAQEAGR